MNNKKAQLDNPIIAFFILAFVLFLLAPIILKVFISVRDPLTSSLSNISVGGNESSAALDYTLTTAIAFWDKVIIFAFFLALLVLILSAIFIDSHPFFMILYIFIAFILILFSGNVFSAVDSLYNNAQFATEVSYLPLLDGLRANFTAFLIGVMILTGVIIYGKYAFLNNNRSRY